MDIKDYNLYVTRLGLATLRGSVDLSLSNTVYKDLMQGLQSLVLAGYLHLLYLVCNTVCKLIPSKYLLG